MYWLEVSVPCDEEAAEAVAEVLRPFAYSDSVVLEQLGDPRKVEPDALLTTVNVKIYIPGDEDSIEKRRRIEEILYHMNRIYPISAPNFLVLEDEDWATAWRKNYHPFRVGERILIQPSWQPAETRGKGDIVITLDPGMAFGTGLHPSTQMCLRALESYLSPGAKVLDVGTGSGILAIAAAKLGAKGVIAFDNDRQAVIAASQNAQLNQVDDAIAIYHGTLAALAPTKWDIVVVNILAPVINTLLERANLVDYAGESGTMIFSGIIEEQADSVSSTLKKLGKNLKETYQMNDWICLVA